MASILRLDDQLSNKIAAGEVVERPASVVKELLENSIDAASTIIEVDIEEAGLGKIRVIDNGDGILPEDCLNAFHRHATSKIKDENDLFRIRTLGFRGEALPSIASVSCLEMKTGTGDGHGTKLVLEGGKILTHEPAASRKGTDITVTNLFFNTPARLKYMKSVSTELGNITDVMNRIALSNPHISFRLVHNGKQISYTNGNGDVKQVLASIYGLNTAKKMVAFSAESLDFRINGYLSLPEMTRASRNYMSIMINGRYVRNYSLSKAIQQGYHTLLPIGRYPIAVLEIEMDPILVDVNVHPSKLEVRLSKEAELNQLLTNEIQAVFKSRQLIPEVSAKIVKLKEVSQQEQQHFSFEHVPSSQLIKEPYSTPEQKQAEPELEAESHSVLIAENDYISRAEEAESVAEETSAAIGSFESEESVLLSDLGNFQEELQSETFSPSVRIPPLYPIGQMHGTYILAQNENGLYLIDQHAAQERIYYEYFKNKVADVSMEVQELLVPLTFDYSSNEAAAIEENREELEKVGIFPEPFGGGSYLIRSHPQWFPKGEEESIITDILQQVITERSISLHKLREEAAIMMSCKASIKANHHLRNDEIFALLETLRSSEDPFTCPHGRPIIVHFSTYEMEKMFKRVM
ncbi:DNA mismatch repair endonuclease MutL [Bacillus lacus]|uniref:DNA mismatch repair protein MutL n=1 Tax=Metabacillus lacus TaxID=1983721 RepID=A0A7X2IVR4_9BACI|nr:DNA mismatch repair endonuclease MutL [Metabacillus lacus]MRX70681.1 DNA mismatch repair endonuclease MutL [Metabacillus lacus]